MLILRQITTQPISFSPSARNGLVLAAAVTSGMAMFGATRGDAADQTTIALVFPDAPASYIVTLDGKGNAITAPLGKVVWVAPSPPTPPPNPPNPPQPPTPPPGPLTPRATSFRDAAAKATADPDRAGTAQALAMMYREVVKLVEAKTITDSATLAKATSTGITAVLTRKKAPLTAWVAFDAEYESDWAFVQIGEAKRTQKFPDDYVSLLNDAASGLDASVPQSKGSIDPKWIEELVMQIIQLILQSLNK
jgi:hypothetical protein